MVLQKLVVAGIMSLFRCIASDSKAADGCVRCRPVVLGRLRKRTLCLLAATARHLILPLGCRMRTRTSLKLPLFHSWTRNGFLCSINLTTEQEFTGCAPQRLPKKQ